MRDGRRQPDALAKAPSVGTMSNESILLVDDDLHVLASMADWLRDQGYAVETADSVETGRQALAEHSPQLALVDVRLRDGDGFELLRTCREEHPDVAVILITGYGTMDSAIEAVRAGAFDYLTKPIIDEELLMAIERACRQKQVVEENQQLRRKLDRQMGLDGIAGRDHQMLKVFDVVESVAETRATVLVTGESGTGKSLIARAIHRRSDRRDQPLVEVACGALPDTLLESELFGHQAGAFTGATTDKPGKFLLADGGTIFLDEIGTASLSMQVKLLRVLQELEFESIGGTQTHKVDVRVILATNEDLGELVRQGKFREDLFYRVNVINLELPPLRDRPGDVPLLAEQFLRKVCQDLDKPELRFSQAAMAALQSYNWPGNVRELQNVVERAVLLGKGEEVTLEDLPSAMTATTACVETSSSSGTLKEALEGPERQIILAALGRNGWNRQETADALGVNRTTLYKKMKRLGLEDRAPAAAPQG